MTDAIRTASNVYAALEAAVALGPDRPAIIFEGETITYGAFKAMVDNAALHLHEKGHLPPSAPTVRS
jgi:acyl-CoA synthetase (AMP-forming)/AMP-acid ligase II